MPSFRPTPVRGAHATAPPRGVRSGSAARRAALLALVLVLALAGAAAAGDVTAKAPAADDDAPAALPDETAAAREAAFLEGLRDVEVHMQAERWEEAHAALLALVDAHEGGAHVVGKLADLRQILRRCRFWMGQPRLDPEQAVSGDLRLDNRTTGRVKVVYDEHHGWSDFELLPPPAGAASGLVLAHPLDFSGPCAIEVSGVTRGATPTLVVALAGERAFAVDVGLEFAAGGRFLPLTPETGWREGVRHAARARLVAWERGGALPVATGASVPVTARARYTLGVSLTSRRLEVTYNGKRVLVLDDPATTRGQVGILLPADAPSPFREGIVDTVALEGVAGSGWLGGLRDRLEREAWAEHDRLYDLDDELPAWLLEAEARAADAPLPDAERLALEAVVRAGGDPEQVLAHLAAATARFPRAPEPRMLAALVLLEHGRLDEADRVLETAARDGVRDAQLEWLDDLVTQAVAGPDWGRSHEVTTTHYVVRTDLDARACEDVARVLEDAWERFGLDMPGLHRAPEESLRVYLFSGQRGFLDYVRDSSGIVTHSAAGLYDPRIRQLLIWNLPNADDMLRTVRHEGLHQWLDGALPDAPRWLHEGLAEYYEYGKDEQGRWRLGQTAPHAGVLATSPHGPVPLAAFVAQDDAAFFADPVLHYAQSWAFVHFLRHGGALVEGRMERLLAVLASGATREAALAQAFAGVDWSAWDSAFAQHAGD